MQTLEPCDREQLPITPKKASELPYLHGIAENEHSEIRKNLLLAKLPVFFEEYGCKGSEGVVLNRAES